MEVEVSGDLLALFPLCADILDTLCTAVLRVCPQELSPHVLTIVTTLMPLAAHIRTTHGKQVCAHLALYLISIATLNPI